MKLLPKLALRAQPVRQRRRAALAVALQRARVPRRAAPPLADGLDALHDRRREAVQHAQRVEVLLELRERRGAEDDGRDVRVLERPRDGELRRRAAELRRDRRELVRRVDLP